MRKVLAVFSMFMVLAWCVVDVGTVVAWDLGKCLEKSMGDGSYCYDKDKKLRKLRDAAKKGDGKTSYLAYNVWLTRRADNQKCINYKDGPILPAGTEILAGITIFNTVVFMAKGMEDEVVSVKFTEVWHPGRSAADYLDMMITEKPFAELTAGMSEIELQGIQDGLIYEGMSKDAVVIAYGYPPEHYTPSLDEDVWIYWENKIKRHRICFGENDRTMPCKHRKAKKMKVTGKPL